MGTVIRIYFRKEPIRDYFVSQFQGSASSVVKLTRDNDMGRLVYSLVKYSDLPVNKNPKQMNDWFPLSVSLPESRFLLDQGRFAYIPFEDLHKINDYVIAQFNLSFNSFLMMGETLNIQIKNTVDLFMQTYNINPRAHDALIKKDFRARQNLRCRITQVAQTLGYL
jgi:hypothetical protein